MKPHVQSLLTFPSKAFGRQALQKLVVPAALLVAATTAQAQITGVATSSVQAIFTSANGGYISPVVGFTYPGSAAFSYTDGIGTVAGTAITGGFFIPTRRNIASTFVLIPQTSYLLQNVNQIGLATMTMNYSITYNVGALGVLAGFQTGGYNVYGSLNPIFAGSFADFTATINYNKVGGGFLGGLSMTSGIINWANDPTGIFNFNIGTRGRIAGFAGPGQFTASGTIQWACDPASLDIGAQPMATPEPSAYCVLGVGVAGLLIRRRRAKSSH